METRLSSGGLSRVDNTDSHREAGEKSSAFFILQSIAGMGYAGLRQPKNMLKMKHGIQKAETATTPLQPKMHFVQKIIGNDTYMVMSQSQVMLEDEFSSLYYTASNQSNLFLMPPYEPNVLMNLVQTNNILNQCIDVMEVNIDGTGHTFEPAEVGKDIDSKEEDQARAFFDEPYPNTSFIKIRRKLRRQMESTGYAYLEVLRNMIGDIVGLRNIETNHVRFVKLDAPILVKKTINRDGKDIEMTMWDRERRFAQRVALKQLVYYREYGTTRQVNRNTGEWEEPGKPIDPKDWGTELLVFGITPDITTPYFVPRWINDLPSVIGSRKAEEQNLQFLDSGGMPPAIIFVQGGTLAKDASDQLRMYLSGQNKNKFRAVVVEAQSSSGSLDSSGSVTVKVERFGSQGEKDALYMKYDVSTENHVRQSFRLPPLFLGGVEGHNFACYDDDTETLTDHGWVKRSQYVEGMKVAAVTSRGDLKFEVPEALSVYDVSDLEMYHFSNQCVDMMVTPNHRMRYCTNSKKFRITPVEKMAELVRTYTGVTANWVDGEAIKQFSPPHIVVRGGENAYLIPHHAIKANDFLEFMGWYASEGHTLNESYAVLTQHPARGLKQIRALADRFRPLNYAIRESPIKNTCIQVMFGYYSLVQWLKKEVGQGEHKRLPLWMLQLPKVQLQILFDALMAGDGTKDSRKGRTCMSYSSVSAKLAGQVQEIAFKLGYAANIRVDRPGTYGNLPVHRVLISNRVKATIDIKHNLKRERYTGKVHCFTVSTGIYVTRRNGKIAIQGNTASVSYMIAEAQIFEPARDEFDVVINKTIIKELGFKTLRIKSVPITMKDIASMLKGFELAKDTSTRESFLEEINKATGTDLELAPMPQPDQVMIRNQITGTEATPVTDLTQGASGKTVSQVPHEQLPASTKPPAIGTKVIPLPHPKSAVAPGAATASTQTASPGGVPAPKKAPKKAIELIELAHDYAASQGLVRKREMTAEQKLIIREKVDELEGADMEAFDTLLATYTFGQDDPDLVAIAKFNRSHVEKSGGGNPNHDEKGRFSSGESDIFVSPNDQEETLTFHDATHNLTSDKHIAMHGLAVDVMNKVDSGGKVHDVIGDWSDGAENSMVLESHTGNKARVDYMASLLGDQGNYQKAVIPFVADSKGADTVWKFTANENAEKVRGKLDSLGVHFRTLEPQGDSTHVWVFDPGTSLKETMEKVGKVYGTVKQVKGTGEFLGGETRAEGHAAYTRVINSFESRAGNKPYPRRNTGV